LIDLLIGLAPMWLWYIRIYC